MSDNMQNVQPIDHTTGSAFATTAGSTIGGGLKTGLKSMMYWTLGVTALGLFAITGGFGLLAGAAGTAVLGGHTLGGLMLWGTGFATLGLFTSGFAGTLGALFGAGKGAYDGSRRVGAERAAAAEMQAQVAMAQAQGPVASQQTFSVDPRFNQASSSIQADSAVSDGRLNQLALQRA